MLNLLVDTVRLNTDIYKLISIFPLEIKHILVPPKRILSVPPIVTKQAQNCQKPAFLVRTNGSSGNRGINMLIVNRTFFYIIVMVDRLINQIIKKYISPTFYHN